MITVAEQLATLNPKRASLPVVVAVDEAAQTVDVVDDGQVHEDVPVTLAPTFEGPLAPGMRILLVARDDCMIAVAVDWVELAAECAYEEVRRHNELDPRSEQPFPVISPRDRVLEFD